MTGSQFASLIRLYTRTNTSTLTDANIVLMANTIKDDMAREIIKADENYFGSLATRDLVASDANDLTKREYTLLDNILRIKHVEAALDGTNWVPLIEINNVQRRTVSTEASILENFTNEKGMARYEIFRKSLWIYSGTITATTAGLKLWSIVYPADISDSTLAGSTDLSVDPSTATAGMPRQFHEIWARKVSKMYKSSREKPIPLTEMELNVESDFTKAISSITNANLDRENTASLPDDTHLQY